MATQPAGESEEVVRMRVALAKLQRENAQQRAKVTAVRRENEQLKEEALLAHRYQDRTIQRLEQELEALRDRLRFVPKTSNESFDSVPRTGETLVNSRSTRRRSPGRRTRSPENRPFNALSPRFSTMARESSDQASVPFPEGASQTDMMDLFRKREEAVTRLVEANKVLSGEKAELEAKVGELEESMVNAALALKERGRVVSTVRGIMRRNDAVRSDLCGTMRKVRTRKMGRGEVQDCLGRASDGAQGTDRMLRQLLDVFSETELLHAGVGINPSAAYTASRRSSSAQSLLHIRMAAPPRNTKRSRSPPAIPV